MNGPHGVSFDFRYAVYLPVMGNLWDQPAGFNRAAPDQHGFRAFPYFGA